MFNTPHPNIPDGPAAERWWFVSLLIMQIEDAQVIQWNENTLQFLRVHGDKQHVIEWEFGADLFDSYLGLPEQARANLLAQKSDWIAQAINTPEKLDDLPAGLKVRGYIPKRNQ